MRRQAWYSGATLASLEHPSLQPLEDIGDSPRKTGVKAAELAALQRRGVPLPVTWVLDAAPFREWTETELPRDHTPRALLKLNKPLARMERAARAGEQILEAKLGPGLEGALGSLWSRLEPIAPLGLAVRASPSCDDDSVAYMAGLSGVELGVRGAAELAQAIRRIWSLAFLPRALSYLNRRKVRDLAMAVLIQPVLGAEVSGVLVTRPPSSPLSSSWRHGERVANAWWGLGARVEGGDAAVDVVRFTVDGALISAQIADKRASLGVRDGGVHLDEVEASKARAPCLTEGRLRALAGLAERLDAARGGADGDAPAGDGYEVSFAFVDEQPVVLQAQRGPRRGYPEGGGERTVWSRATVTESLSGVVSPLTLSLSEPFMEESFRTTFQKLGCSVPDDRLIVGVQGRAYLNLSVLMQMAVQLPGISAHSVIQIAGVEGLETLEKQLDGVSRRSFYTRLPLTAARQIAEQSAVGTLVERFEALHSDEERSIEDIDLAILPDDALVPRLRDLRSLLGGATTMLATTTTAYVTTHLVLQATLGRTLPVHADRLARVLSAGVPTLEATRASVALGLVAAIARDEPAARDRLLAGAARLGDLPPGPTRSALGRFLTEHGHHARLAAELMTPRWSEDPAPLLAILGALVRGGRSGERAIAEVRARADRERAAIERKMPLLDRLAVRGLVERCRRLADLRERARGRFLRVMALCRKAIVEIDRRLRRVDRRLEPGSAFFCTFDELLAALGTGRPRVAHLVLPRRRERERDLAQPDPPTTFVGAPPPVLLPPAGEGVWRGLAVSSGVAVGKARVVHDVIRDGASLQPGEILVVKSADLGLAPLFLVASGLISQQGGHLTQGSVVARELGVPAVASLPGATRTLRTGDLLRIDGDEGTVERLQGAS